MVPLCIQHPGNVCAEVPPSVNPSWGYMAQPCYWAAQGTSWLRDPEEWETPLLGETNSSFSLLSFAFQWLLEPSFALEAVGNSQASCCIK